ncbi:6-phosphogluconate dehydrogenase, NADP-binding [Dillenia turbinata]|uniref:3-hydroxyisobutyrate dehydrogenase n=1 Tax=Dillenia turbinata TaxID=194707 RepID=A0AAN8VQK1_9MAGN
MIAMVGFSYQNIQYISNSDQAYVSFSWSLLPPNRNSNAMKMFSENRVATKVTPYEVAESSDVVITMLPSSSSVLDVYTGHNGLLDGGSLLRPWLLIDSSTIDPQTSRKLSLAVSNCVLKEKRVKEEGQQSTDERKLALMGFNQEEIEKLHGLLNILSTDVCSWTQSRNWTTPVMLDAPVSGGTVAAEAGTLTFMVGGREDAYLAAQALLLSMGKNTIYCGEAGNGSAAKICNNLAMAVSMLGVSEAFALGQSLGITAKTLTKIFSSSSASCWSSNSYNPVPGVMEGVPSSRDYKGGFASKLMAKDLSLAVASAQEVGFNCPFTLKAKELYVELCKKDHDSEDFSCVFRHFYSGRDEH